MSPTEADEQHSVSRGRWFRRGCLWTAIAIVTGTLAALVLLRSKPTRDLYPAGSLYNALGEQEMLIAIEDDPTIRRRAEEALRGDLFRGAELIVDHQAVQESLAGRTVFVSGTRSHAWFREHAQRLPFRLHDRAVEIEGRRFETERPRVICTLRNPDDLRRRVVLDVANNLEDAGQFGIPAFLEWVVADGERPLVGGWFVGRALTVDEMQADLEETVATIRNVHPATLDGLPPELEQAVERAQGELSVSLTRLQFWIVLSRVMQALGDAHTSVIPPVTGETLAMPWAWTSKGMIITGDAGDLRAGDRIVRLNGYTESQLLELLREITSAENDIRVRQEGESWLIHLSLLRVLGLAAEAPILVTVERAGTQHDVLVSASGPGPSAPAVPWVRFEIDRLHDLGLFVLDECTNDDTYRQTLKQFFAEARAQGITRIAVDLRNNGGGSSSVVNELLRYLDIESYSDYDTMFRTPQGIERYPGEKISNSRVDQPFRGQLFVLTSNTAFSSSNWFAVVVQDNKIGTVLGEQTSNAPTHYGQPRSFTLSQSCLHYRVSCKHFLRPDPARDPADRLVPDLVIPRTRRDLVEGRDAVLEYLRDNR